MKLKDGLAILVTDFNKAPFKDYDVPKMKEHINEGFILLQGSSIFSGKILGGCIDTIYDIFDGTRYKDSPELCKKYFLF